MVELRNVGSESAYRVQPQIVKPVTQLGEHGSQSPTVAARASAVQAPANKPASYSGGTHKQHASNAVDNRASFPTRVSAPTPPASNQNLSPDVSRLINASSAEKRTPAFYRTLNAALQDTGKRAQLIQHFGLNSSTNKEAMKVAVFMEGGQGYRNRNMMVTGEVIMNRAIAMSLVKGSPVPITEVVRKPNQFEINNQRSMHSRNLKTFNEVMADHRSTQYRNSMDSRVASVVDSLASGNRGETGATHYGFKGRGGTNHTDTPNTDYYTVRSW